MSDYFIIRVKNRIFKCQLLRFYHLSPFTYQKQTSPLPLDSPNRLLPTDQRLTLCPNLIANILQYSLSNYVGSAKCKVQFCTNGNFTNIDDVCFFTQKSSNCSIHPGFKYSQLGTVNTLHTQTMVVLCIFATHNDCLRQQMCHEVATSLAQKQY